MDPSEVRKKLSNHYNEEELRNLCFDLVVDYESLPAQGKVAKVRELLWHMANDDRLVELFEKLSSDRPLILWPQDPAEIKNLTVRLQREANRSIWQKRAVILIGVFTLVGVGVIIWLLLFPINSVKKTPIPNGKKFRQVGLADVHVYDLALDPNSDDLWLTAFDEQAKEWSLYNLDTSKREFAIFNEFVFKTQDKNLTILDILVDCNGYVWLLLDEIGPLVIEPVENGDETTIVDLPNWPVSWRTAYSITSHCYENSDLVDIWLARDGIVALQYKLGWPISDNIKIDEHNIASDELQEPKNIVSLHYDPHADSIAALTYFGKLLSLPLTGVQDPGESTVDKAAYFLDRDKKGIYWVGINGGMAYGDIELMELFPEAIDVKFGPITAVAAYDSWVWFGGQCEEDDDNCSALGVVANDKLNPIEEFDLNSVNSIKIDHNGSSWLGTESGLIYYPSQE